jgi:hypothetical protein
MSAMSDEASPVDPIVINLGKQRRKRIKDLKRGRGVLMDEVMQTMAQVTGQLGADANGKVLVPVVLIYREKPKRPMFRF